MQHSPEFIPYRTGTLVNNATPAANLFAQNPFFALSTKIVNVYSEAIRQNMDYLNASSARIIQEQAIKAWTNAAQSCNEALAANAVASQQKAMERIAAANQKAFGMMALNFNPFKMQPMMGFGNWFPVLPVALPSSTSASRRVK